MAGTTTIGVVQRGLARVLKDHTLRVPPNQREYSWEEEHVNDLFQDIARAISTNASEYFLGTIVGIPAAGDTLEIVDGQQRLATTVILLAAMRDFLRPRQEQGDKLILESIENDYLTTIDRVARTRVPRLRLNTLDAAYFEARVLEGKKDTPATAASHRRIDVAANLAQAQVGKIVGPVAAKDQPDLLNAWISYLSDPAQVVLLTVPSALNAYRMFETLNDRGLKTSQADLVKNYLFGESGGRLPEAQTKWAGMKSLLESLDDEDITITFLRQMLISYHGHLRDSEVYETVQSKARGEAPSIKMLGLLAESALHYVAMLNPAHEKWNAYPPATRKALGTLLLLRMKPLRPLMLAIVRTMSEKETDKALRLLVNVAARLLIAGGGRTGSVEEGIANAAHDVSGKKVQNAADLLKRLEPLLPNDATFEDAFKTATVSQAYLARYYLRAMELRAANDPEPCFVPNDNQNEINLEHVLPKEPMGNWPQFNDDERKAYTKRIGNLALLKASENSGNQSDAFATKKPVFKNSAFKLTQDIDTYATWDVAAIKKRQDALAVLAVKTWPLKV